ncbi:MAG: winged helix-turn-helix domain-containing protein [Dehalococcoidia bacterium]
MSNRIILGNLEIERGRLEAWADGRRVDLTLVEFRLLREIAADPNRVVSRQRLLEIVRSGSPAAKDRALTTQMSRLRKKIAASRPWRIEAVTKRGYALRNTLREPRLPMFVLAHAPVTHTRALVEGR